MSGFFYISTQGGDIYELTLTSDVNITYNTTSSSFPVEDGSKISDNVINDKIKITYKGLLSNIVNYSLLDPLKHKSVEENVSALVNLRESRTPFTVNYDSRNTNDKLLPAVDNCVFDRLEFSRSANSADHYKVEISVSQIIVTARASQITQPEQEEDTSKQSANIRDSSANSTKNVKKDKRDLLSKMYDGSIDFFSEGGQ